MQTKIENITENYGHLLGRYTDEMIANIINESICKVTKARQSLGVNGVVRDTDLLIKPTPVGWSSSELEMLSTLNDTQVSKKTNRPVDAVRIMRNMIKDSLVNVDNQPKKEVNHKRWSKKEDSRLLYHKKRGKTIKHIAKLLNRSYESTKCRYGRIKPDQTSMVNKTPKYSKTTVQILLSNDMTTSYKAQVLSMSVKEVKEAIKDIS